MSQKLLMGYGGFQVDSHISNSLPDRVGGNEVESGECQSNLI